MKWSQVGREIESSVRKAMYEFALVEGVNRVGVALSGGKDSLTLLLMLKAISGRGFAPFEVIALHVAGEFTCGAGVDGEYLKRVCEELGVELKVRRSTKTLEELECYSCSRERRSLLFAMAREAGAGVVAFGHHRDDSAQTLLMNLFQKGEFAALLPKVPMHKYGVTIIRPMIYVAEAEVRAFAAAEGFARVTCQCPVGQTSRRRSVEEWLKVAEADFPHVRGNLAQAGLLYGSDKALAP